MVYALYVNKFLTSKQQVTYSFILYLLELGFGRYFLLSLPLSGQPFFEIFV